MCAWPMMGLPTLFQFIDRVEQQGCTVNQDRTEEGHLRTTFIGTNGKRAFIIAIENDERLMPTTINRINRRLGLSWPFSPF